MDQQGAGTEPLRRMAIQFGVYAGVFLAGAILAFLYSYIPLHNAKNWKIDYLEERLVAKDTEVGALERKIADLEGDTADKPDAQTFKQVQEELASAHTTVKELERQVAKLEGRTRDVEKSRNDWKSKFEAAESSRLAATRSAAPVRSVPADAGPASIPAAAATIGEPLVADALVPIGTRWRSPDGRSDFDLVAISDDVARVVPNASALRPGNVPEIREVSAGQQFEIDAPGGRILRVVVERIEGTSGIVIDVTD